MRRYLVLFSLSACAGNAPARSAEGAYQDYECPEPIGRIVREDCSEAALRYEAIAASGALGVGPFGASGSFSEHALREPDPLIALFKEQRVALCNDFNSCKLTVSEYLAERQVSHDSYVAVLALKRSCGP